MRDRESKVEGSMPVQSRVDIVDLAKMDNYWRSNGYEIRTMSQLVSWSVTLLCEVLEANDAMPVKIESITDANRYLIARGLRQASMHRRSMKKLTTAIAFESMRGEELDPKMSNTYNMVHRKLGKNNTSGIGGSVEPFVGEVTSIIDDDEHERAMERIKEEKEKERKAQMERELNDARESGLVVSDEWIEERKRKDEEVAKRENTPFDPSMIKTVEEP
jgi:hypothetical protein